MWALIQYLIIAAVVMSNVHWQWTHNPCAAGLIGIGVAFSFTVVVTRLADALRSVARWSAQKMADRLMTPDVREVPFGRPGATSRLVTSCRADRRCRRSFVACT